MNQVTPTIQGGTTMPQQSGSPSTVPVIQTSVPTAPTTSTASPPSRSMPKTIFVHPFITMIDKNVPESEMVNTLCAFVGPTEFGQDTNGNTIYESVDQTEFIAPVLQVFSFCASNGRKQVVQWLIENFVPLDVSYDNNFCYTESLRWSHSDIADMIACHESFRPNMEILENLISRKKYDVFKKCMTSPYITGTLKNISIHNDELC